jgi:hypothetical protein
MKEYLQMGHMELVPQEEVDNPVAPTYYIPHHFVLKASSTTTKFRAVFDESAKTPSGFSLNDTMMVGPTIQDNLTEIAMRFRCHPIAFTADKAKMDRQIRVSKTDADLQRIFWRNNPDEPLKEYRLLTVTYGTVSAPFLATRTLQQLARDESKSFPLAAEIVLRDFYVDDVMSGSRSDEEAIILQTQLVALCSQGGMELRKWSSNSDLLMKALDPSLRECQSSDDCKDLTSQFSTPHDQTVKCLGISWNTTKDVFQFKVNFPHQEGNMYSKRGVLSEIARLFDPIGWLSPVIVQAKIFMQSLWKITIGWDELLPEVLQQFWIDFKLNLADISSILIPRCVMPSTYIYLELHGFSDASEKAYSAVVFLYVIVADGPPIVSNITSKTRVAPAKTISLPRLELCGAHLLLELLKLVEKSKSIQRHGSTQQLSSHGSTRSHRHSRHS